jgi:hypothetical protein
MGTEGEREDEALQPDSFDVEERLGCAPGARPQVLSNTRTLRRARAACGGEMDRPRLYVSFLDYCLRPLFFFLPHSILLPVHNHSSLRPQFPISAPSSARLPAPLPRECVHIASAVVHDVAIRSERMAYIAPFTHICKSTLD